MNTTLLAYSIVLNKQIANYSFSWREKRERGRKTCDITNTFCYFNLYERYLVYNNSNSNLVGFNLLFFLKVNTSYTTLFSSTFFISFIIFLLLYCSLLLLLIIIIIYYYYYLLFLYIKKILLTQQRTTNNNTTIK